MFNAIRSFIDHQQEERTWTTKICERL